MPDRWKTFSDQIWLAQVFSSNQNFWNTRTQRGNIVQTSLARQRRRKETAFHLVKGSVYSWSRGPRGQGFKTALHANSDSLSPLKDRGQETGHMRGSNLNSQPEIPASLFYNSLTPVTSLCLLFCYCVSFLSVPWGQRGHVYCFRDIHSV